MPVILREQIPSGEVVIWETTEDYQTLSASANPNDLESAERFAHTARRTGHLAARAAVRTVIPDAVVSYDDHGAPFLNNNSKNIGLSHCKGAAAAIVSDCPCAIDIEPSARDFTKAAPRFLSLNERQLPEAGHPLFLPALWCAKETLYKFAGLPGLDFLMDLEITGSDLTALPEGGTGRFTARIKEVNGLEVAVRTLGRFIFCYMANITAKGKIK